MVYSITLGLLFLINLIFSFIIYKSDRFSFDIFLFNHYKPPNIRLILSDLFVSSISFGILSKIVILNGGLIQEIIKSVFIFGIFIIIKAVTFFILKLFTK